MVLDKVIIEAKFFVYVYYSYYNILNAIILQLFIFYIFKSGVLNV